jgi:hypothetical protein
MRYFDKKVQQAQDETTKLINDYAGALKASPEAKSIKSMMDTGVSAASLADRAFKVHSSLFSKVMGGAPPKLLKETRRVLIIEQFCLQLWAKMLGEGPYRAMLDKTRQRTSQPKR